MTLSTPSKDTELFVFDLDGTLAPSKLPIEDSMIKILSKLLEKKKVAVIGGGSFELFTWQFSLMMNDTEANLSNLFLFPTSGAQYFSFSKEKNEWQNIYKKNTFSVGEKEKITKAINESIQKSNVEMPKEIFGEIIEDRETQITFSPFGQKAPLELKINWDKDQKKRTLIKSILESLIPEYEIRIGGTTSIDITGKGIDKAYGIRMMEEHLHIPVSHMFFVGDALFPGGNDESVLKTGVAAQKVEDNKETERFIVSVLEHL